MGMGLERMREAIVFCLVFCGSWASAATLAPKVFPLSVDGQALVLPSQLSHSLEGKHSVVRRVVIAIHSASYNAQEAYNAVIIAAGGHQGEADETAIIAPQFLRSSELPGTIPDNLLYWNNFPFRGTSSARYGPEAKQVSISALEVIDRILEAVTDEALFPNLETIVVAGFSAGGQLVNRYAAAGIFESTLPASRQIHIRHLVMSPSSYLYFGPERDPDGDGVFEIPGAGCGGYNDWGYGLKALYSYPAIVGEALIKQRYPKRFVFYLVGSEDNDPADPSLATSCESSLQGPDRVARAQTYFLHLLDFFGEDLLRYQHLELVPETGHSYSGMLKSVAGRRYLLDMDPTDTDRDGQTDWAEWIAGSDPSLAADFFRPELDFVNKPADPGIVWPVQPRRLYQIWRAPSPGGPFSLEETIDGDVLDGMARWRFPIGDAPQFLRVDVQLN